MEKSDIQEEVQRALSGLASGLRQANEFHLKLKELLSEEGALRNIKGGNEYKTWH